jgi:response regulator RpfG family c-di-GMP phosphodiesterase
MTNREAIPDDEARNRIRENAGSQFDPANVDTFLALALALAEADAPPSRTVAGGTSASR